MIVILSGVTKLKLSKIEKDSLDGKTEIQYRSFEVIGEEGEVMLTMTGQNLAVEVEK